MQKFEQVISSLRTTYITRICDEIYHFCSFRVDTVIYDKGKDKYTHIYRNRHNECHTLNHISIEAAKIHLHELYLVICSEADELLNSSYDDEKYLAFDDYLRVTIPE